MKLFRIILPLVAIMSASAFAADKAVSVPTSWEGRGFGLGLATVNAGTLGTVSMLSGYVTVKPSIGIQLYFGIPTTTGGFNFMAGGAAKFTVSGTQQTGFHVGGDVLLGSLASNFTAIFGGLAGIHYSPVSNVMFAFDGGPQIGIASGNSDFNVGGVSGFLGASVIYFF